MKREIDFAKFSSVKIGCVCEVSVINSVDDDAVGFLMIGAGNNILVSNNPPKIAMLGDSFDYIKIDGDILEIGGACKSGKIYNFAKKNDLANFEFLKSIPGTLGGLVKMNAGLGGVSVSDYLTHVRLKSGWIERENFNFSYRYSGINECIYGAKFKIKRGFSQDKAKFFEEKRANQPRGASFGSVFVNPHGDYAGRLLEAVGLKGYVKGGAMFSDVHANFMINFNNASFDDAMWLINEAKRRVKDSFHIELKCEVVVL
ncbi:UDP-N-acetylenolpyruvoylglucosamine reductase [Campylobacter majalis]|uniref:UDP-N-acetylenolpyruvoylglucosamine reductase n=1 Tax=Campylobacter majalis TaxID=2790656 RepID=A0ABM8Q595_9BACT|nr:UDP-N-acetylmuramate dehydrogenase [Campylobacter majalis]CAD7288049.1 UDP-N-acetylenolpyruvoylglucosamine reductase [Campylobacter majalis]